MGNSLTKSPCYFLAFFLFVCVFVFMFMFVFFGFRVSPTPSFDRSSARPDLYIQDFGRRVEEKMAVSLLTARRILSGPGSSPPRCTAKCGSCTPCKPVHVPVPPGTPVTAEYYPEAWRCKCGNKLYMP